MATMSERLQAALSDRYTVERELGSGGMARVYLARDTRHRRAVAIKVLRPEIAWTFGGDRFLREIEIAAGLTHPHILPLFDSGRIETSGAGAVPEGELLYYVMPYVQGDSLRHRLRRDGKLPIDEAVRIARQVASALAHAHSRGVVHRDIKPENILLEEGEAVVADFGIARAFAAAGGVTLSEPGMILGTPSYMSPEQAAGGEVDARSDIYSLGCVLYEMLGGSTPFHGGNAQVIFAQHNAQRPPPLRAARPDLPADVEAVVMRALAKLPDERFQRAADLAGALPGDGTTGPRRAGPRPGRRKAAVAAVAVVGLGILVASQLRAPGAARFDPDRVIVDPIAHAQPPSALVATASDARVALLAALNSTSTLVALSDAGADRRKADRPRAAFVIRPTLVAGDSLRLVLELIDVRADSSIQRVISLPPDAGAWRLGVRAAQAVLPLLIPTGQQWDLSRLSERSPAAVAEFLYGERAYRRGQFAEAFTRFRGAVEADSGFGLAALRGALAAVWVDRPEEAAGLAERALRDTSGLSVWHRAMATGLAAYLGGAADSAVSHYKAAVSANAARPEGWMALGEVYTHLLPRAAPLDSLATAAFLMAHAADSAFAPALPHLIEQAVREGRIGRAVELSARLRASGADSAELQTASLLIACGRRPLADTAWRTAALARPAAVVSAAYVFAVAGLRRPECAEGAWRAILAHDTTSGRPNAFGALVGLQSLLLARGRPGEADSLLAADTLAADELVGDIYIMDALAGAPFRAQAESAAVEARRALAEGEVLSTPALWFLATWETAAGREQAAEALADTIARRADASGSRLERLLAGTLAARAMLARGDSSAALAMLSRLPPTGTRREVAWNPWQALAHERALLAGLLLARGDAAGATAVASSFDAPSSVINLLYLPASLRLRERAAAAAGDRARAADARARLAALEKPEQ